MTRSALILTAALFPVLFGCGQRLPYEVVPFSGTVTYEGKPVANLSVFFEPETGRPSTGATDDNGRFTMTYTVKLDGVQKGKGKFYFEVPVMIGEDASPMARIIREKYGPSSTPLVFDIQKPENNFEIKLD